MAVLRELVTKLGFQFDRTGLDKFEKSIVGFKTKFTLGAISVAAFAKKTLDYFSQIATATLDINEFARGTGIATERFLALQKAADNFRVKNFAGAFSKINEAIQDASHGVDGLFDDLLKKSQGHLNLFPFIQKNDIEGAINEINKYAISLNNIQEATRLFTHAFGPENASGFVNIILAGNNALSAGADANKAYAKSIVNSQKNLAIYESNLKLFYQNLGELTQAFVENILPLITGVVKGLSGILSGKSFTKEGQAELHKNVDFSKINERAEENRNEAKNQFASFFDGIKAYVENREPANQTIINNKMEFNVPPGTPEGQATEITKFIQNYFETEFELKTREIINNNPAYE